MDNIQKTQDSVQDYAEEKIEEGRNKWNELRDQAGDAMDEACSQTNDLLEDAQGFVQKHPGKSLGVALLVGAAAGLFIASRIQSD